MYAKIQKKSNKSSIDWIKFKDKYIESNLLFPVQLRDKVLEVNNFEKNYSNYY